MKSIFILYSLILAATAYSQEEPKHFQKSKNRFKIGTDLDRGNPSFNYEFLVEKNVSIEMGFGLTFDDSYAIKYWEGHQYIKRNNFSNTRYSFSFGINFLPIPKVPFLYMGIEGKFRKYYSADQDFFLSSSGYFLGAKRSESTFKFKVGNFFQFNHFLIDYSAGVGLMVSSDKWAYFDYSNYPDNTYHSDKGIVNKTVFSVELKIGLGGKKVWKQL